MWSTSEKPVSDSAAKAVTDSPRHRIRAVKKAAIRFRFLMVLRFLSLLF